jgi:hypothetical protein
MIGCIAKGQLLRLLAGFLQKSTESGILFFGNHLISIYLMVTGLFMGLFPDLKLNPVP